VLEMYCDGPGRHSLPLHGPYSAAEVRRKKRKNEAEFIPPPPPPQWCFGARPPADGFGPCVCEVPGGQPNNVRFEGRYYICECGRR
jgi:hypothetical protein